MQIASPPNAPAHMNLCSWQPFASAGQCSACLRVACFVVQYGAQKAISPKECQRFQDCPELGSGDESCDGEEGVGGFGGFGSLL